MSMKFLRAAVVSVALFGATSLVSSAWAQSDAPAAAQATPEAAPAPEAAGDAKPLIDTTLVGDVTKGLRVFQTKGCQRCHGWDGAGLGRDPRAPGPAANLRQTELDDASMRDVVRCGIPGSPMPFHDSQAYKDDRCYGMTFADFDDLTRPVKGKTFREQDIANVVAYVQETLKGKPEATLADCEAYFGTGEKACDFLR